MNNILHFTRHLSKREMLPFSFLVSVLSFVFLVIICYAELGHNLGWDLADTIHANLHNSHRWVRLPW